MAQVLSISFGDDRRTYDYYYDGEQGEAAAGDKCVVVSPHSSYILVDVITVRLAAEQDMLLKKVRVLVSLREDREKAEKAIKRKAALQQLDAMLNEQSALDKYASLRSNPAAAALLDQLDKL